MSGIQSYLMMLGCITGLNARVLTAGDFVSEVIIPSRGYLNGESLYLNDRIGGMALLRRTSSLGDLKAAHEAGSLRRDKKLKEAALDRWIYEISRLVGRIRLFEEGVILLFFSPVDASTDRKILERLVCISDAVVDLEWVRDFAAGGKYADEAINAHLKISGIRH